MSLADYLAKNYLTADAKPDKKSKKRKRKGAGDGLVIADDDTTGWEGQKDASRRDDDDDNNRPTTETTYRSAEFRKSKANNWQIIGAAPPPLSSSSSTIIKNGDNEDAAAANAIIANAAAESAALANEDDDGPLIEGEDADDPPRMSSGARAGLQTAAQLGAQLKRAAAAERAALVAEGEHGMGKNSETIYRDASGRIVNVAMKRAEARAKADAEAARLAQEAEEAKGDVQRRLKTQRKEELQDAKFLTLARGKDDAAMNAEMKEQERWNDPAREFVQRKDKGKSVTGRPLYKGASQPNRYGILPGHRWDGVDRGIGFEAQWFKARNRRANLQALDYAWQMDE